MVIDDWTFAAVLDAGAVVGLIASRDPATVVGDNLEILLYQRVDDGYGGVAIDSDGLDLWAASVWPDLARDAALGGAIAATLPPDADGAAALAVADVLAAAIDEAVIVPLSDPVVPLVPQTLSGTAGETLTAGVAASDPLSPVLTAVPPADAASLVDSLVDAGWAATDIQYTALGSDTTQPPPFQTMLTWIATYFEQYEVTGDVVTATDAVMHLQQQQQQQQQQQPQADLCLRWTSYSRWSAWSAWSCGPWVRISGAQRTAISATAHNVEWDFERTTTRTRFRTVHRQCWNCNTRTGGRDETETGTQRERYWVTIPAGDPTPPTPTAPNGVGAGTCSPNHGGTSRTKVWNPPLAPC